jgi:hypothetical protein
MANAKVMQFGEVVVPEKVRADKLYPVAMVGHLADTYPSVKEAISNPDIKHKMLMALFDYARLAEEGKCEANPYYDFQPKDNIAKCIVEYPKVIIENHFNADHDAIASDIIEAGQVRIPFPMLTLLAGERTQDNTSLVMNALRDQDGSTNLLYCCFAFQVDSAVVLSAVFSKPKDAHKRISLVSTVLSVQDGQLRQEYIANDDTDIDIVVDEIMSALVYMGLVAIHKLTFSGGEIYMARPTPDEVAVNRKRINKGKKPLVEFRLITIDGKKKELPTTPHGTHASPRQHWRRGHWRTMKKSGKKVWVDPMLVGDEENGKIIKDYAVGKYDETTKKSI